MESKALLEGFQDSISTHGLIYKYFIGEGDSNFYKNLLDRNPYAELKIIPRKIECTNHLLRNFCKKNMTVASMTQKKGKRVKGFVALRNIVKSNVFKICQAVIDEIDKQRADTTKSWESKVKDLQRNILNIPSHIFGEHKRCKDYGFNCNRDADSLENEVNYVPYLKAHGFYKRIQDHVKYLRFHADSLLPKFTNNLVESLNNIFCKQINGKRVNYACSNQYNTRVAIAIIQHNTQEAFTKIYQGMEKEVPQIIDELQRNRKLKISRTKESRAINGRKRKYACIGADKNYGVNCEKPDFTEEQLSEVRKKHFEELQENQYKIIV